MISRVDFNDYNNAVAELTSMATQDAQRQISAWMQLNPDATVAEIRDFAKETMDGLVQVYGEAASSLAAQWYDFEAGKAGKKLPVAITETTYDADQVKRVAHYQAKKLADGDINGFLDACGEYMENATKQSLNNTILANVKRDKEQGIRFARVTTGAETCSFCYMLSSRGAVYYSRHSAGEQNHYHRGCDCKIVPGFDENTHDEIVEGYDPRGMQNRMNLIEQQTGLKFGYGPDMSALSHEMKLRNAQWLMDGTTPRFDTYESEEAKAFKYQNKQSTEQHEKELKTAERIAKYGFDTTFVIDEIEGEDKGVTIGLADLKTGLEIKTLEDASSYNTIDGYIAQTSKKQNATALVFDNYDNKDLSDETLEEWINKSRRFRRGSIYIFDHEGKIRKIR